MEAIAANPLLPIFNRDGVGRCLGRHGLVKDGVEAGVVPGAGKALHHVADQRNGRGIVQRGETHRLLQVLEHVIGNALMPVEERTGMDHPVANGIDPRHAGPADSAF